MEHTTVRLGKIGETAIIHDIVKNYDYPIYEPIVDDVGVDLVVDRGDKFFKLQVKTIANPSKETSVEVRLRKYDKMAFDRVAIYYPRKDIIAYVPFNGEKSVNLAFKRAKNGQVKNRIWVYEFMEFPQK